MMKFLFLILMFVISENSFAQTGTASWYGPGFHGRRTASGQTFNTHSYTAAHKTIAFGTKVKVTNLKNKRTVLVTVNDRGPYFRGRIIDLSQAAKNAIGMEGTAPVSIQVIK